ncbi:DUF305 domain-containing protein [Lentzea sp. HUAS12]|uniref:DUF305 domain-containing protein n=1 Tax=Lentzea sp. HUAS12 TaxID=2951806 RepID=UPI00209DF804|nr:DUF305 domain-containing protein [Lentzea sp. HUAS12]USX54663.1 DUF305 domain-containing protein [Lentzea sp. HUAS12]
MRALLLTAVLAAAACGTPAAGTPVPTDLSATDLAFVDLVIPQNESVLAALALADRPGSALGPVVARVGERYRSELAQARELLARAGKAESDQHEGHDMPGMITAAELAAVEHVQGADFDLRLKVLLRTQFEEARTVARAELASGTSRPALELGEHIDSSRAEFLELLGGSRQ